MPELERWRECSRRKFPTGREPGGEGKQIRPYHGSNSCLPFLLRWRWLLSSKAFDAAIDWPGIHHPLARSTQHGMCTRLHSAAAHYNRGWLFLDALSRPLRRRDLKPPYCPLSAHLVSKPKDCHSAIIATLNKRCQIMGKYLNIILYLLSNHSPLLLAFEVIKTVLLLHFSAPIFLAWTIYGNI